MTVSRETLRVHAQLSKIDPSKTKTLRRKFSGDARKRFRAIRGLIRDAIIEKGALGDLTGPETNVAAFPWTHQAIPARPGQFDFPRTPEKVGAFMDWLRTQMKAEVLEVTPGPGRTVTGAEAWTSKYVRAGYQQGMRRGRQELRQGGIRGIDLSETAIANAFDHPMHADRVGLLYTRVFETLERITDDVGDAVRDVLSAGIAKGENPRVIARNLSNRVAVIGENRARVMARTEVVRAHHVANINTFREVGITQATVEAEWATAGDDRVCTECEGLEGQVFDLDRMEGMIPLHPQCRCVALPVVTDRHREEAARSRESGSPRSR